MLLARAAQGDAKIVAQLLAQRPEMVDEVDDGGQTALHYAAQGGHVEAIKQLLAHKPALIDIFDNLKFWIPLHVAAAAGHGEVVALLLAHKPELIDVADRSRGQNALHYAAAGGHEHIVEQLLALRPSLINGRDLSGKTALHLAARDGHDGVVAKLLAMGTLIEREEKMAAQREHAKLVESLVAFSGPYNPNTPLPPMLEEPTLVNVRDYRGSNALHFAVRQGQEAVVAVLLAHSPDLIDSTTSFGKETALHLAALCASREDRLRVMSQLIAIRPSLIHAVNGEGRPALFLGAMRGDEIVELLLPLAPEQVFLKDFHDNTLLHCCLFERRCNEVMNNKLIEKVWRMNPEALFMTNVDDQTPFHLAAANREWAFELFQWKFPLDDIVQVLAAKRYAQGEALKKIQPLVVGECNGPLMKCLHQDLVDLISEYLGFKRCTKRKHEEATC